MSSTPIPAPNNSPAFPGNKMTLYARAAANLYGVIKFDDFFKVLESYYGEGSLSKEKVFFFLWTNKEPDPIYYVQNELIAHMSISPDEVTNVLRDIKINGDPRTHGQRRILPEKEFLQYADPSFYERTNGAKEMESFLKDKLGFSSDDVRDIVTEMDFLCRSGASPIYLMDAIERREIPCNEHRELDIITHGCVMEGEARLWERLGFTGKELQARIG